MRGALFLSQLLLTLSFMTVEQAIAQTESSRGPDQDATTSTPQAERQSNQSTKAPTGPTRVVIQPPGLSQTQDARQSVRKVAIPDRGRIGADALEPLSQVSNLLDDKDLSPPPDSSIGELVGYLDQLSMLSRSIEEDYRSIRLKISQSQADVANQLLSEASSLSDEQFYVAARFALSKYISDIPTSDSAQQREITGLVLRQLEIGSRAGIGVLEVRNAVRTVGYLERHAPRGLTLQASEAFRKLIVEAGNERFDDSVAALEDVERRLSLVGQTIELTGTSIDGMPFDWSDYRGKVVLINFWTAWNAPSLADIPELKRTLELYRDQGFSIVGVCLDRDRSRAEAMIEKESIPWVNLWDASQPQRHPAAVSYGVDGVPTAFLVDREGRVISTRARGEGLRHELYRLLGPESYIARDYAAEQRWADAAEELKRLIAKYPSSIEYRLALGAIELRGDDTAGYANTCSLAWQAWRGDDGAIPAEAIPLFCLSNQHPLNPSLILAEAVRRESELGDVASYVALAMAAYRAGNDDLCMRVKLRDADHFSNAITHLIQAMSAQRQGDVVKAQTLLRQGRRTVSLQLIGPYFGGSEDEPYEHWICWAIAGLLLEEAEAAFGQP